MEPEANQQCSPGTVSTWASRESLRDRPQGKLTRDLEEDLTPDIISTLNENVSAKISPLSVRVLLGGEAGSSAKECRRRTLSNSSPVCPPPPLQHPFRFLFCPFLWCDIGHISEPLSAFIFLFYHGFKGLSINHKLKQTSESAEHHMNGPWYEIENCVSEKRAFLKKKKKFGNACSAASHVA